MNNGKNAMVKKGKSKGMVRRYPNQHASSRNHDPHLAESGVARFESTARSSSRVMLPHEERRVIKLAARLLWRMRNRDVDEDPTLEELALIEAEVAPMVLQSQNAG